MKIKMDLKYILNPTFLFAITFTTLIACGQIKTNDINSAKTELNLADSTQITNLNSSHDNKVFKKENQSWNYYKPLKQSNHPTVFAPSTILYAEADTTSQVLEVLKFQTSLLLIGKGNSNNSYWYKVIAINGGIEGYVKAEDVATYFFDGFPFTYFVVTDDSKKYNPSENGGITIYKFNCYKKQFLDTLIVNENSGKDGIREINHGCWKNVDFILSITEYGNSCGQGGIEQFVIDANGNLSELISRGYWGETGADWGESHIWLPIKPTGTNEIWHVNNGDLSNICNVDPTELSLFKVPEGINVPKNELVFYKEIEEKPVLNKIGEVIENKDGSYKMNRIKDVTKIFKWTGIKLEQIK